MSSPVSSSRSHDHVGGTVASSPASTAAQANSSFASFLRKAVESADRAHAKALPAPPPGNDTARALALQAEVYRQAERVELASRLVDHAVGAVKTLLQSRF